MKKIGALLSVFLTILFISIVSVSAEDYAAGAPFGNKVPTPQAPNSCWDSDDGIYPGIAGAVLAAKYSKNKITYSYKTAGKEVCTGEKVDVIGSDGKLIPNAKSSISEKYCATTGLISSVTLTSGSIIPSSDIPLSEGYCITEEVTITNPAYNNGKPKKLQAAKWVPLGPACVQLDNGAVLRNGEKVLNRCEGSGASSKSIVVTCGANGAVETPTDCINGCNPNTKKCYASCTDTDSANNKDVAGSVTVTDDAGNEVITPDSCNAAKTAVVQYKCSSTGRSSAALDAQSCGTNKECALNSLGEAYCRDKFAGADINQRVEDLESMVSTLKAIVCSLAPTNPAC